MEMIIPKEKRVVEINKIKKQNSSADTIDLENQIDQLVYKLYELTYEEVQVIDPEFSLTKKEYDALKLEA